MKTATRIYNSLGDNEKVKIDALMKQGFTMIDALVKYFREMVR